MPAGWGAVKVFSDHVSFSGTWVLPDLGKSSQYKCLFPITELKLQKGRSNVSQEPKRRHEKGQQASTSEGVFLQSRNQYRKTFFVIVTGKTGWVEEDEKTKWI
ncbi:hypothetical protein HGM15179_009419 [Zosterops borbonicus]|uniref:Uncharacterized protein n=1 Tax=Zosterops borbonicus TaxID=364589 RepID=A0A8K1LL62_9PASS|nr:hypothetical protein HGM15179_009419 [Zosterops borbonicus]